MRSLLASVTNPQEAFVTPEKGWQEGLPNGVFLAAGLRKASCSRRRFGVERQ